MHRWLLALLITTVCASLAFAGRTLPSAPVILNCCKVYDMPAWTDAERIKGVVARVEDDLNWTIRRIKVQFYADASKFSATSGLRFSASAYMRKDDQSVHLGPDVRADNFDAIFGHELVHVIFAQKYKAAIPAWLEEGLANHVGSKRPVDYGWLSQQKLSDVTKLVHPNTDEAGARYHYAASTAVTEMIAARCSLNDLLMLSVGRKLSDKLATFCKIPDVNAAYREWVAEKAKATRTSRN